MISISPALSHLAWAQVWQVTFVMLAVGLVTRYACRSRPHLAHLLWMLVLVKCLTPPVWSCPTGIFSWSAALASAPPTGSSGGNGLDEFARAYGAGWGRAATGEGETPAAAGQLETHRDLAVSHSSDVSTRRLPSGWFQGTAVVAGLWFLGACACGAVMTASACRLWRRIRRGQLPVDASLIELATRLARSLNVSQRTRLLVIRESLGPLAFGCLRPTVVLPVSLVSVCTIDELEPIVAHELMHVRRRDGLVGLLQLVVQCLWWFHPLVWWVNRRIVEDRERCCDEAVIGRLGWQPGRYARSLLKVLEWKSQILWLAPIPGIRTFEINRQRFECLLRRQGRFRQATPRGYWLLFVAGILLLVPGAGRVRTAAGAADESSPVIAAEQVRESPATDDVKIEPPVVASVADDEVVPDKAAVAPQAPPQGPVNEIYAMHADGSGARKVTSIPDYPIINSPEISPDGKWIAVDGWNWQENLQDAHLLFVHVETGQVRDLGIGAMPTWSADGRWIAYSKYPPDGGVFVREVDGDNQRLIDRGGWGIQWSPDGYKLAYARGGNIVVYDFIADTWKEIFPPGKQPYNNIYWNCKWSPDSRRICFKGQRHNGTIDIAIVSAVGDAPNLQVCCDGKEFNEDIAWHPHEARIILPKGGTAAGPSQLYEFNPDKADPPRLVVGQPTDRNNAGMCWSRDGKTLYFISQK